MKKWITIILALFAQFATFSQTPSNSIINVEVEMQAIDYKVTVMKNAVNTYQKVIKKNSAEGHRILFFKGEELKLISVTSVEPTLEKSVQWYFEDGKLLFTEVRWTAKMREESMHDMVYLKDEHIIGWKTLNGRVDPDSEKFKNEDKALNEYAQKIKNER